MNDDDEHSVEDDFDPPHLDPEEAPYWVEPPILPIDDSDEMPF